MRSEVEGSLPTDPGRSRRVALVGETIEQVREVMVFGESGILACSPPDRRPVWRATRKMLEWPNGATAQIFSASEPESLRGPQFDAAWVDEIGCAAIDKGTNQPNKFIDLKSSESSLPKYSDGRRDDLMQMQYLRAMYEYWDDGANNPVSGLYGGAMVDMSRAFVWAWDTRPFPYFPHAIEKWSDAPNYFRGHWLNGRSNARSLADVVVEICARSGVTGIDVSGLFGYVRGYTVSDIGGARSALQPLMLVYGFEAIERNGQLIFRNRTGLANAMVNEDRIAYLTEQETPVEKVRAPVAELAGRLLLSFVDADGDYEIRTEDAVFPDDSSGVISKSEFPLLLARTEARAITEGWLAQARVARDGARFSLPMSGIDVGAGDVVALQEGGQETLYRIDRVTQGDAQLLEGVRVEPEQYDASDAADEPAELRAFSPPAPVYPIFLDLPLLSGAEVPHAPHIAVTAHPWPGSAAVFSSATDADYGLNTLVTVPAVIGISVTAMVPGQAAVLDRGAALRVSLTSGTLASATLNAVLNGANVAAIGDGSPGNWEVFQYTDATLVSDGVYDIKGRLRGQAGTDPLADTTWPAGSIFVLLNGAVGQIELDAASRGLDRHYRVGPASRPLDDPSYQHMVHAFDGIGLRPLAPVHLRADVQGSGDYDLQWMRRTRIDGDSWVSSDVPLGEDAESYQVDVVSGGSIVRSTFVNAPVWSYSAAAQVSDGISSPFSIQIAQISARFGPGLFRRIDL